MPMRRLQATSLVSCLLALVAASGSLGGCCRDVTTTQCLDWDPSTPCPDPKAAALKLGAGSSEVKGPGTFWPAHEYLINGARTIEPAACCYEVTSTLCDRDLH